MLEKLGIGIDIVEINRFTEKPFANNQQFYKKVFHDSEIKYCLNHINSSQSFAAKFAVKEALIKAIDQKIDLLDIITDNVNSK
ncbi:MAG: 4'-phosphopantetheinyl transferase superfamily protein, partial [Candidatus Nitrosotenuis sp.]